MNFYDEIRGRLGDLILGNNEAIECLLIALYCQKHILFEGPPGCGKTFLAKSLGQNLDLTYARIQATDDLSAKDILGCGVLDRYKLREKIVWGPIRNNIVLIDEINRMKPKTQSALFEALGEKTVSVNGQTIYLPTPHMVVATQNPHDKNGTNQLPPPQLDRFLFQIKMDYVEKEVEKKLLEKKDEKIKPPLKQDYKGILEEIEKVWVDGRMIDYFMDIVEQTRVRRECIRGASTRCVKDFYLAAKTRAHLHGREMVEVSDIDFLAHPILRHRIRLNPQNQSYGYTSDNLVDDIIRKTKRLWGLTPT